MVERGHASDQRCPWQKLQINLGLFFGPGGPWAGLSGGYERQVVKDPAGN